MGLKVIQGHRNQHTRIDPPSMISH